jgi:hypothetical protein
MVATLSETWFIEGNIDYELKKYTLLAYLQKVNSYFNEHKLYPQLSDVIFHYNNLMSFKENKDFLKNQFPKRLTGIQIQKLELLYAEIIADNELMEEIERIIHFSTNSLKQTIANGTEIYDTIEHKMTIHPVGILPFDTTEGYFLLNVQGQSSTKAYYYRLTLFEKHDAKYRSIKSQFINEWERNFVNTYESMKAALLKYKSDLTLPAVYAIETKINMPVEESVLPVAKRSLVRYIAEQK